MLEKKLNELNIFALRDFARKTGVSSPTSKKKEQLIKEIIEITTGKKSPNEQKSKQGRPPKVFDYNFASVFNSVETNQISSIQTLNQKAVEYEGDDVVTVAGWLELVNNNAGILWVQKNLKNENYFVSSSVLQDYEVRMGDRIVASINVDESQKVVKRIFSINDNPILKLPSKRKNYDEINNVLPNRELQFNDENLNLLNVKIGENVYIYGTNNNQNTQTIIHLLNNVKTQNKLYVNVSVAGKNQMFLSELKNTENFISNIMDEIDVAKRIVTLAIERAKRILEVGEDVVVAVDDMSSIYGIEKIGEMLMKNLASIAKETKGKGSITLLAVMPNSGFNQIEKLADKRLNISNEKISVVE